jgi:hypothetical protein
MRLRTGRILRGTSHVLAGKYWNRPDKHRGSLECATPSREWSWVDVRHVAKPVEHATASIVVDPQRINNDHMDALLKHARNCDGLQLQDASCGRPVVATKTSHAWTKVF